MTQSWEISKVFHTDTTVSVALFTRTNLRLVDDHRSDDGLYRKAVYVLAEGDESLPLEVRSEIRYNPSAQNGFGTTNISVRLSTVGVYSDDTSGEVLAQQPVSAVIALTIPGVGGLLDNDQALDLVANIYSLWFNGVTGTVPNNTIIPSLAYGLPHLI